MNIQKNISLEKYNTLKVDVKAKFFVKIQSEEDIYDLMKDIIWDNNKRFILGGGANILFQGDYDGLVIKNEIIGKTIIQENEDTILIKVGAGEDWPGWVDRCVEKDLGGIENLALIPGCVGASPIGNIGAYGVEVKDIIYEVEGINLHTGKKEKFKNSECKFGYRDSIFKNEYKDNFIVTYVTWSLIKVNEEYKFNIDYNDIKRKIDEGKINIANLNVKKIADMISDIRRSKLPDWKEIGTAGSFFKNPVITKDEFRSLKSKYDNLLGFDSGDQIKLSAGQLIELAGLKGTKVGKVGTYQYHALVLINEGGTAQEIVDFASKIQKAVKDIFGVWLEPEVNYV